MTSTETSLWDDLLTIVVHSFDPLEDKPEETAEATLRALWFFASSRALSAEQAAQVSELPELTSEQVDKLRELVQTRLSGVPLAHITGRQQFMGVELHAGPQALVPRKETELLGEAVFSLFGEHLQDSPDTLFIDVCTGAGNLGVAIADRLDATKGYISDLSEEAILIARKNIEESGLVTRVFERTGDLLKPFEEEKFLGRVDLIMCNPPYISSGKVAEMPTEISEHEPSQAFDGGPFGISILKRLIKEAPKFLRKGGWLAFEVGLGQGERMVGQLKKKSVYDLITPVMDKDGEIRAILARIAA